MPFFTEKRNQLTKQDKSKKGSKDERILPLLEKMNALPSYYTTSSCSGRIVHVACADLVAANLFLEKVRAVLKKSCILSASNKIIVEVRASSFVTMPLLREGTWLFPQQELSWLISLLNGKMQENWQVMERVRKVVTDHLFSVYTANLNNSGFIRKTFT